MIKWYGMQAKQRKERVDLEGDSLEELCMWWPVQGVKNDIELLS